MFTTTVSATPSPGTCWRWARFWRRASSFVTSGGHAGIDRCPPARNRLLPTTSADRAAAIKDDESRKTAGARPPVKQPWAWRSAGPFELLAQERTDRVQSPIGRREAADKAGETMRHAKPDVELCVDAGFDRARYVAARVLEQDLLVTDVNPDRRQPAQVAEQRRGHGIVRISAAEIGLCQPLDLQSREVGVGRGTRLDARPAERQVGHRRERDGRRRKHVARR